MSAVFYEVSVAHPDEERAQAWLRWMLDEHLAEVIEAGASRGRVIQLDEAEHTYLAQYTFASREAYRRYVAEHAPRLRTEGLRRFPSPPVTYSRRSGEIVT